MSHTAPELEHEVLDVRSPSALLRHDAELASRGVAARDVAATRGALASVGACLEPEAPAAGLRGRLLASFARGGRFGVFADRLARLYDLTPAAAEALTAKLEADSDWMPFLIPGVEMIPVECGPRCAGAVATLVRLQPGVVFPEHVHRGEETMVLLDGGFREEGDAGEEAWRGDEVLRQDGSEHAFVALPGRPCIAAAIVYGVADFK
jgi:putative transcriptional regulator